MVTFETIAEEEQGSSQVHSPVSGYLVCTGSSSRIFKGLHIDLKLVLTALIISSESSEASTEEHLACHHQQIVMGSWQY